ncbi:MAG: sulfatase-like hydrolase/transferase [Acidobacteriota bacterium]
MTRLNRDPLTFLGRAPFLGWAGRTDRRRVPVAVFIASVLVAGVLAFGAPTVEPAARPNLVLVTLDTTRADALGAYGGSAKTPVLDGLVRRGLRFERAITASPLTLPAHASLLTGLDPPAHGVRDNGLAALPSDLPTLATRFADGGWETAAVVASRVLDRRFGLARGFSLYDDSMAAERVGEYGYAEREADRVTDVALAWLANGRDSQAPFFLWVHYYDPHSPYLPAPSPRQGYDAELERVDGQLGRLLAALPPATLVAVVGDHGESLGEHGEDRHGIFLYRAVLEVPLILSGPGVPAGAVVKETVASRRLAPTLASLAGLQALPGEVLPGLTKGDGDAGENTIYSEATLPARAYGWSPLKAVTRGDWRLIAAPRPELYNVIQDPAESDNRVVAERRQARRLRDDLRTLEEEMASRSAPEIEGDAALTEAVRSLGYTAGASSEAMTGPVRIEGRDPKDGIALLARLAEAKDRIAAGRAGEAVPLLEALVQEDSRNVPFWSQLGNARRATGDLTGAVAAYRQAVALNPALGLLRIPLGDALADAGKAEEARREYRAAIERDRRSATAWLRLGEMAARAGKSREERALLSQAAENGADSAALLTRLAQLELAAGDAASAVRRLERATELLPSWSTGWLVLGQASLRAGDRGAAKSAWVEASRLAGNGPEGAQARRWLEELASQEHKAAPPKGGTP